MGPQGPQGSQGPQGVSGMDGATGVNGFPGQQGIQGPMGPAGLQGPQGSQGTVGPSGQQGPLGPQGPSGSDGLPGLPGQNGNDGASGKQGPMGSQGPKGDQGPQGVPGDCVECPCDCEAGEFAEAYSQLVQELSSSPGSNMPGGVVKLETTIIATANIDTSQAATLGQFKVNKAGWYDVAAGMTGTLNPIPAPLPVWTLSLFLNGAIVPGSTFSNVPLSPAQASNEITADTYVYFNMGDILTLANTSTAPVFLSAPTLGTNAQTNSAYLKIQLLRSGAK